METEMELSEYQMKILKETRDSFYDGVNKGEPFHWRDTGPDEIWDHAFRAGMECMLKTLGGTPATRRPPKFQKPYTGQA